MMKGKTHHNKFLRIISMPIRALAKARDLYVRSMNNYADRVCYGAAGFGGSVYADPLTRSFSTNSTRSSDNDDFKELVRAASTSTLGNRIDLSSVLSSSASARETNTSSTLMQQQKSNLGGLKRVPRSASVGMAMIEEDKPCEFDDANVGRHGVNDNGDADKKQKSRLFPRSRSYAVGATN